MKVAWRVVVLLFVALGLLDLGCKVDDRPVVVVYTALDEIYACTIFDNLERDLDLQIRAVYDSEANKTTGLTNRLVAEAERPRADVFWNNEVAQTIRLKEEGLLAPYEPSNTTDFPDAFKDDDGYWTGFAARGRVIVYNPAMTNDPPKSIHDFTDPKWRGKLAIANPLFGTTATHAAALFALWGPERAKKFFLDMKANDVAVLPGNATVRDMVAQGEYAAGLTDTDDANSGIEHGLEIAWHFPEQRADAIGTLVIPNTVALVKNGPNPEDARKVIDYLLGPETERKLAESPSMQIPLGAKATAPHGVPVLTDIRAMDVTFDDIAAHFEEAAAFVRDEYL